jgi:hypothetical protein
MVCGSRIYRTQRTGENTMTTRLDELQAALDAERVAMMNATTAPSPELAAASNALCDAAVNALPDLLAVARAAQRVVDARAALLLPDGVNAAEEYFSSVTALPTALAKLTGDV